MPYLPENPPVFLADHPVLDLLNTVFIPEATAVDALQSDADVLYWLEEAGMAPSQTPALPRGALVQAAHELRSIIRALVERRKAGKRLDLGPLNTILRNAASYPQLAGAGASLRLERHRPAQAAEDVLAPVAEAAAEFLATADFDLVRPCEGKDCILWFYDRTKSHRRRWCSMQVCGNRHKVEAFRERQRA
ncbi:MAG: ABATE domain-containing protein [Edaphobacter sp.]|uniref:CGNR zinc finger domain-containing protein n=1 Tax=Edaphobacter sp. TaxID=1934404 RepID=UPI0023A5672D|nr:ABATE domain-containing protein [Edaphobacter sp.]MDE1178614.1 ABATE domain-containing protein [Edaphobacter sp.]